MVYNANKFVDKNNMEILNVEDDYQALEVEFKELFYPSHLISNEDALKLGQEDINDLLTQFNFFQFCDCKIYNVINKFEFLQKKLQHLFTSMNAIETSFCYGVVGNANSASLIFGVPVTKDKNNFLGILKGTLGEISIEIIDSDNIVDRNHSNNRSKRYIGTIIGNPSLPLEGKQEESDISPVIRNLYGQNYMLLILCKPVNEKIIQKQLEKALELKDKYAALATRNISTQLGLSMGHSESCSGSLSESNSKGKSTHDTISVGGGVPFISAQNSETYGQSESRTVTKILGNSRSESASFNTNFSVSSQIETSFAQELLSKISDVIERLKLGRNIGLWDTVITYSSDNEIGYNLIKSTLHRVLSSGNLGKLPPVTFSCKILDTNCESEVQNEPLLMIPKGFLDTTKDEKSPLSNFMNSEELCGVFSIPTENIVGFEIQEIKRFAINYQSTTNEKSIGNICDYDCPINNHFFGIAENDLVKHTFVCGITGSGKTNTVKQILNAIDTPYLVIEPVKKEYRHSTKVDTIYTLGNPELRGLKINPFYVPMGIKPNQHIDYLKDLFSASFAFYGPMPYIFEKCLNNIYAKKGWDLTLGIHPLLNNAKYADEQFGQKTLEDSYSNETHKYLFPTMDDLKDEIKRYLTEELDYENEIKGNIKSAIQTRIEGLCVGSKGYIFNTADVVDFKKIFESKVVIEIEGLSDDSDKAFTLGLLLIYLNEYRRVDEAINRGTGLKHLLVIEEAHRLLKNISLEINSERGNAKGKAVEHFTNILAEMRSYGEGVIVVEQIPTKLAADVIKNSSNKIVHRIVAKDDQDIVSNTINVNRSEAVSLGYLKTGFALCHKEGMIQPVVVRLERAPESITLDSELYMDNLDEKLFEINKSILKSYYSESFNKWSIQLLFLILLEKDLETIRYYFKNICGEIEDKEVMKPISTIRFADTIETLVLECIADNVIELLSFSIFTNRELLSNEQVKVIRNFINSSNQKNYTNLTELLNAYYHMILKTVAELISKQLWGDYCRDMRGFIDYDDFSRALIN